MEIKSKSQVARNPKTPKKKVRRPFITELHVTVCSCSKCFSAFYLSVETRVDQPKAAPQTPPKKNVENGIEALTQEEIIEQNRAKFISKQLGGGKPEKIRCATLYTSCIANEGLHSKIRKFIFVTHKMSGHGFD